MCAVGFKGKDCVQIIRKYPFPAMRTRTPTSSSMIMVEHDHDKLLEAAKRNDSGFEVLAKDFGIKENYCGETVTYLNKHIADIAKEALKGTTEGIFVVPVSTNTEFVMSSRPVHHFPWILEHSRVHDIYPIFQGGAAMRLESLIANLMSDNSTKS